MTPLGILQFEDQTVRSKEFDGLPWFCGRDICRCLKLKNVSQALARLKLGDRRDGVCIVDPIGRRQQVIFISLPAVFALILTSRVEIAERFQDWLTHEVLMSIFITGRYDNQRSAQPFDLRKLIEDLGGCGPVAGMFREWRMTFGRAGARQYIELLGFPATTPELTMTAEPIDDQLVDFAAERLMARRGSRLPATELHAAYREWCSDNDIVPLTQTMVGRRLAELGWMKMRADGRVLYLDVALAHDVPSDDAASSTAALSH